jgi:xanthine/uracil permease
MVVQERQKADRQLRRVLPGVAVATVILVGGMIVSTWMISRYVNLPSVGVLALVTAQLFCAGVGAVIGSRANPHKTLLVLGGLSLLTMILARVAPQPTLSDRFVVGWNQPLWTLMVLPGVLLFACWVGVVLAWLTLSGQVETEQCVSGREDGSAQAADVAGKSQSLSPDNQMEGETVA